VIGVWAMSLLIWMASSSVFRTSYFEQSHAGQDHCYSSGKCLETLPDFALKKHEHWPPILDTVTNVPGQTASYGVVATPSL
jgi:hypothetical protein